MFTKDITIINKRFNQALRKNEYVISEIKGFWSSNNGITLSNTSLVKSNGVVVRVLLSEKGYLSPKEFNNAQNGNNKVWTLQNDDYIVKGKISEQSITTINTILDKYECMKITNVSIKDYGSQDMQHFEVSGE